MVCSLYLAYAKAEQARVMIFGRPSNNLNRKSKARVGERIFQGHGSFSTRGMVYSIALCLCLCACSADDPLLYSSAISPDGVWIAENFGTDGCCNGGFVLIHKKSESSSRSDAVIFSPSPAPGIFMIWQDNKSLSLVRDSDDLPLTGPSVYRGITVVYSTYQSRTNFDVASVSKRSMDIREGDATAETAEEITKTGRRCKLSINVRDGTVYDKVGARIEASINRCNRARDCAAISSEFWLGQRIDGQHGVVLTSATVSEIPSYNRLPEGDRNSAVRGGFGERSAVDLVTALGSETMDIKYSLNFFDVIISYRVPTKQIATAIESFKVCIGDGDFGWLIHENTKPSSGEHPDK